MGTVHIQHIVQCGGGHPHREILLPGLLVQVREVGVGLAFIGKGIEVCVGIILGQQEVGQLVALPVHRPQGVVGLVVIGQRAASNDELLVNTARARVTCNRGRFHMRIILDKNAGIGAESKYACSFISSAVHIVAFYEDSAILHKQFAIRTHSNTCIGIVLIYEQRAIFVYYDSVATRGISVNSPVLIAAAIQIVFSSVRNMQSYTVLILSVLTSKRIETLSNRLGLHRAIVDRHFLITSPNTAICFDI